MEPDGVLMAQCRSNLPFKLTGDQERAVTEISQDMQDERPMQRCITR